MVEEEGEANDRLLPCGCEIVEVEGEAHGRLLPCGREMVGCEECESVDVRVSRAKGKRVALRVHNMSEWEI
ncbi:hypothetical protein AMTR_s00030p00234050 [Amborella trichopoda]|uniref:Uncharacterized protein n=1 Tax=Amborella trichopoda TaxID=13333 RepID=U5D742_AMBTC|nr:hypothetical protein AMTR_s00030p00234050 [Amborella trichopoda]